MCRQSGFDVPMAGKESGAVQESISIITDSSACFPPMLGRRFGVHTVPIQVHVGGDEFRDGVDLDPSTLYEAMSRGVPVKSAAPTPLDYLDAIEAAGPGPAVVITPSRQFTLMHRNATLAAELSGGRATIVDARSAAAAHGLVVAAAVRAREAGGGLDDIVAAAEDAAVRVELVAFLDSLEFLRQSGRVPAATLGLANRIGVRPVFRMRDGTAERVGLPRSEAAALRRVTRAWREGGGPSCPRSVVFHAHRADRARELAETIGEAAAITEFSAAMAIHTGPGVVGVAWVRPSASPESSR